MTGGRGHHGAGLMVLGVLALAVAGGCTDSVSSDAATPSMSDVDVTDRLFSCLREAGFDVTLGESGEIRLAGVDDEIQAAYAAAHDDCRGELVAEELLLQDTDDDLRIEHGLAAELHRCLVAAGFPLVDLPSESDFVAQGGAFNILEATAPIDLLQATSACNPEFTALENR